MIESFRRQEQMSVLELYIENDVVGGFMFHSANSVRSRGHNLSNKIDSWKVTQWGGPHTCLNMTI